jgi:hypothetical protein
MDITTNTDDQVLASLNALEARRFHTDAAFRSINDVEVAARREKTERLRAARMQASPTRQ